jgi:4-amino-4-deoxy-L-arabinose transferase-like glycosyltransferase
VADAPRPRNPFSAPWSIVWVALVVRIAYMTLAHTWRIRPYDDHFSFGWEMARIARSLVSGHGYSSPFTGNTGPTAWITPAYPLLIAGVFKLFGVYTAFSAWVLLAINCVLNALMVLTTWEIAARCFATASPSPLRGQKIALWSAWLWALYPAAMQYAVRWIWEMTLTAFLFSCVLVLALRMRGIGEQPDAPPETHQTASRWAVFGLLWGLIALSNPEICIILPVLGLWIIAGAGRRWPHQLGKAALGALLCLAIIAPWTLRNWHAFHQWVPLRGNFGAELYLGNGPGANGLLMEYNHPEEDPAQLRLYKQMGELKYARMRGDKAKALIRADWPRFARLSATRFYYFWFSVPHPADDAPWVEYGRNLNYQFLSIAGILGLALALRRRIPAAGIFAACFLLLPLLYYFVTVHARFRHPFEPILDILAVYLFQSAEKTRRARSPGSIENPAPVRSIG